MMYGDVQREMNLRWCKSMREDGLSCIFIDYNVPVSQSNWQHVAAQCGIYTGVIGKEGETLEFGGVSFTYILYNVGDRVKP